MKKITLNFTTVRYIEENGLWFNAKDVADALCYAFPRDASRKMPDKKYVLMYTRHKVPQLQLCRVLSTSQVLAYALKRSVSLAKKIMRDLTASGLDFVPIELPEIAAQHKQAKNKTSKPVRQRREFVAERYLPSEDTDED